MQNNLPNAVLMELTSICNHQCLFCYCPWENDKNYNLKELPTTDWCAILDKLKTYGVEEVTFTGGEASTRKDLFEIIDHAHKLGYRIGLISNGKLLDENFLQKLVPYNVMLNISVPGIKTFAETTKTDGVEHTLGLFDLCKKLGIYVGANITVTKKNLGELYENIALPIIHGADTILINRFLPGGRGMQNQEFLLSQDEFNQLLDTAEEVLSKAGIHGDIGTETPYCIVKNPDKYQYIHMASTCAAGKGFFVIDPSGYVKVCNHSPQPCCHWTEIETLKDNPYWQKFVNHDYLPKMCQGCEHLGVKCEGGCREAAHVVNGAIDAPDPCFNENKTKVRGVKL